MDFFTYVPLAFVAIGLVIAGAGVLGILRTRAFLASARRVPGTVTDVRTRLTGSGDTLRARQRPVLTFTTLEGREVTTEAREISAAGVGNDIGVLYDPVNPTIAQVDEDLSRWSGLGMVVVGLIFAAFAFGLFTAVRAGFDSTDPFDQAPPGSSVECTDIDDEPIDC